MPISSPFDNKDALAIGGGLVGGGAGIFMLVTMLLNNYSVLTQHGDELNRLNNNVAESVKTVQILEARVQNLEGKVVGRGPDGFHRQDWERERRILDHQHRQLELVLEQLEKSMKRCCGKSP